MPTTKITLRRGTLGDFWLGDRSLSFFSLFFFFFFSFFSFFLFLFFLFLFFFFSLSHSFQQKVMNRLKYNQTSTYYDIIKEFKIPDTGKTWKMNRTGGIQIPKKCRMSKQKRARLVKGKSISQKSFALAAAKKGTRK